MIPLWENCSISISFVLQIISNFIKTTCIMFEQKCIYECIPSNVEMLLLGFTFCSSASIFHHHKDLGMEHLCQLHSLWARL